MNEDKKMNNSSGNNLSRNKIEANYDKRNDNNDDNNSNNSEKWATKVNFHNNNQKQDIKNDDEEQFNSSSKNNLKRREKEPPIKDDFSDDINEVQNNNVKIFKENEGKKENKNINNIDHELIVNSESDKIEINESQLKLNLNKNKSKSKKNNELIEDDVKDDNKNEKSENVKLNEIRSSRNKSDIKLKDGDGKNESTEKKNKSSNRKGLKRKDQTVYTDNEFNLDGLGKIKIAEQHASANRILKQIKDFDSKTIFCPCCYLPCEKAGTLERFGFCDDTDNFTNFGQGTSLYFSYFKYSIILMAAASVIIAIPFLIFSYQYTYALRKVCNYYYKNELNIDEKKDLMDYCNLYITVEEFASGNYSLIDSPFFLFSSVNIKDYRKLYYRIYQDVDNKKFEKAILNYPLLSLLFSISLLIVNILFIIIIYNKNIGYDFDLISPSDYSVLITNMEDAFLHYLNVRKEYEELQKKEPDKLNKDGTPFDFEKEMLKKLGISDAYLEEYTKKKTTKNKKFNKFKKAKTDKNELKDNNHKKNKLSKLKEFSAYIENNICIGPKKEKYRVEQLNICYKLSDFMKLEEKLHLINKQIIKIKYHPYQIKKNDELQLEGDKRKYFDSLLSGYNLFWLNCCEKGIELSKLNDEKEEIEKEIESRVKSQDINENNFAGVAFVSFNTLKEQEDFLSQFPSNIVSYFLKIILDLKYLFCCCCLKKDLKVNLDVIVAPEPEDVIYENLEYTSFQKTVRTIIVYIISILLIGICFGIFIGLNVLQENLNNKAIHFILSYVISLLNTCVSSILNTTFQMILDFLTKMEKQYTMTEYYRSYSLKLTIFTFFTSAVVPLICELIRRSSGYEILISNMLMMFLVNAFVTPIMWTLNFTFFLKEFRICLLKWNKDPKEVDKSHNMTQRELNDLFELPDMCISYKYSYLAKTLLMTFLYIPIFPLGILISLLGFILGYLLEKFNYSHMYKRPEMLNHKLCVFYVNHFDIIIFVYAIGDYIFMHDAYENGVIPLAKIIIFAIITIVPYSKLLKKNCLGVQESNINTKEYSEKFFTFSTDYERANPMTRKKGIKHYLQKMFESGKINDKEYRRYMKQFESLNLMKIYYDNRKNQGTFNAQKIYASYNGNKPTFLNDILMNNDENNDVDYNNINIMNYREENIENKNDINNERIDVNEDNEQKENDKKIMNIYNNPLFMNIGCTIQSYLKQVINKPENEDNKEDNLMIIKENSEDSKQKID